MKRSLLLCILFIFALTAPLLHTAEAAKPSGQATILQDILILNSYNPGYAWSDDEQAGIIDVFRAKDKNWLPVIEYLDLKRLPDGRHLAKIKQLFRLKYQNQKFSAIIALDNPALEFAIQNQTELFRNAPNVFCGINHYTPSMLKWHSNVTGIVEAIDQVSTIELMLRLHPKTREILVIHDHTATGLEGRKEIEALAPRFVAQVRFRFLDRLSMDEVLKKLGSLPNDSLVLLRAFTTDRTGHNFGLIETTQLFTKHSPVPVYAAHEQRLGFGIVGGKLLSARIHGADAARIALRVLAGEKASAIPVDLESDSQFMFDYKVMSRFGIPLSALPEHSTVINRQVSFYSAHRVVIQTALGIVVFMAVVITLLTINIIQRRQSTNALRALETKYYDLYENAPDMLLSVDAKTATIIEYNSTLLHTTGYAKEDIAGRSIFEICHPDSKEAAERLFQQFKTTGEVRDAEFKIMHKDGSIIDVSLNASAVRDKEGNITHSRSICRDISARKRAEETLKESESKYRNLIDQAWDAIFITDNTGNMVLVNEQACQMLAYTQEELIRLNIADTYPVEERAIAAQRIATVQPNDHLRYERSMVRKDGTIFPVEVAIGMLPNGMIQGIVRNITERKRSEEALRRTEENFRRSLDQSPLGVRIVTIEGETIYANRAILDFYGYDRFEELKTTPLKERYTPESYAEFQIRKEKRKRGDYSPSEYEISIVRKDGEVHHLQVFSKEILWNDERQFQVMYNDITKRKKAEEALRESEERFRELVENINDVHYELDEQGILKYTSPSVEHLLGYSQAEIMGRSIKNFLVPEDVPRALKNIQGSIDGAILPHEYRIRAKSLEIRWIRVLSSPIIKDDKVVGIRGILSDITERKKAEEELRESEERYRNLAIVDDLTQLYNSRHFYSQLKMETDRANRYGQPLTLMLIDLDDFKRFNDTYGHIEGDQVLLRLGQVVKRCLRQTDSAYRYGGEEFTILLSMTTVSDGAVTAERIRIEFKKESFFPTPGQDVHVTVSIGIAQYKPQENIKTFIHRVDQLMYQGKKSGKDEICYEL